MKVYVPIASYNDAQDILELFPGKPYQEHEGQAIIANFLEGKGNYHTYDEHDPESFYQPQTRRDDPDAILVKASDGHNYAVRLTSGDLNLLLKRIPNHGYYIDIYELSDPDMWGEYKPEGYVCPLERLTIGELLDRIENLTEELNSVAEEIKRRAGDED